MSAKTPIDSEPSEETDREDEDQVTQDEVDKDQNDEGERNMVGDCGMEWLNDSDLYHIGPQEVSDALCNIMHFALFTASLLTHYPLLFLMHYLCPHPSGQPDGTAERHWPGY